MADSATLVSIDGRQYVVPAAWLDEPTLRALLPSEIDPARPIRAAWLSGHLTEAIRAVCESHVVTVEAPPPLTAAAVFDFIAARKKELEGGGCWGDKKAGAVFLAHVGRELLNAVEAGALWSSTVNWHRVAAGLGHKSGAPLWAEALETLSDEARRALLEGLQNSAANFRG